jgi:hypothetical protein
MSHQKQPTKEQIRQYMESRQAQHCPPPPMPEIRRQLGWDLLPESCQTSPAIRAAIPTIAEP